jgi:beta-glucosidase
MSKDAFPKNFLWGASTASHQVEGGTTNQWSTWERAKAGELARNAKKRVGWVPVWDKIKPQAENPENYISGQGIDHYHRYKEDFKLLKTLNLNSFRFGIEWSRLEPSEGIWDEAEIEHYRRYIQSLKKLNIEPILNLWHWTIPLWFSEKGGFEKTANLKYFERFAEKITREYGQDVKYIITLNEPNVYTSLSYMNGEWPPEAKNPLVALKVYWHLSQAHKKVYKIIKKINPKLQVGIALHLNNSQAYSDNLVDKTVASAASYGWNRWFLNRIKHCQDFIGINYYHTDYWHKFKSQNPKKPVNDLGWYMEPAGIYNVLMSAHKNYGKPLIITENGVADADDSYRQWWLEETMAAMRRALADGVDLRGYLHWSLLDNFEWAYGWWPKFGLIAVDREHKMKRVVRPSARWWAKQLAKIRQL